MVNLNDVTLRVFQAKEIKPSLDVNDSSEKLLLYQLLLLMMSRQVNVLLQIIFLSLGSIPLIFTIYSFQKIVTVTFENVCRLAYETSSSVKKNALEYNATAVCVIFDS